MKILVIGTVGFIRYHLVLKLLQRGEISSNKLVQSKTYPNHKFIKMDLVNTNDMYALFEKEKFNAVCNLAAQAR